MVYCIYNDITCMRAVYIHDIVILRWGPITRLSRAVARSLAPHKGYEILSRWADRFRHSSVAEEIRSILRSTATNPAYSSFDSLPAEPYEVLGHAGAFYIFTSNVDGHHYDWFRPEELRECHGNLELYQCSFGRARCGPGLWRAPLEWRFQVDDDLKAYAGAGTQQVSQAPRAGRVGAVGAPRTEALRHMPPSETPQALLERSFSDNHVRCARCRGPARPAVLMFGEWGDKEWLDSQAQAQRWKSYLEALGQVVTSKPGLRCVLLELGAGLRVPTVRETSEQILELLLEGGAQAHLVRINPTHCEADNVHLAPHVVSLKSTALECLAAMDAMM